MNLHLQLNDEQQAHSSSSVPAAGPSNKHASSALMPFGFPFNPMNLSLFDADPSRLLSILHHQTVLAEEALRLVQVYTPRV